VLTGPDLGGERREKGVIIQQIGPSAIHREHQGQSCLERIHLKGINLALLGEKGKGGYLKRHQEITDAEKSKVRGENVESADFRFTYFGEYTWQLEGFLGKKFNKQWGEVRGSGTVRDVKILYGGTESEKIRKRKRELNKSSIVRRSK